MSDPKPAGGIFWKVIVTGAGTGAFLAATIAFLAAFILSLRQTISDRAKTAV